MKASQVRQRFELLEVGEKLGFPRLPYAYQRAIRAGEAMWERFAASATPSALTAALRHAHLLSTYQLETGSNVTPGPLTVSAVMVDEVKAKRLAGLEKAWAAKRAKAAARHAAQEAG